MRRPVAPSSLRRLVSSRSVAASRADTANRAREDSRWLRPRCLPGVEALQATFRRHRYRPHAHRTWTVALMRRGTAAFELEAQRYLAPPGSVFILAPELAHTGEPALPDGYSYEVIYLDPERVAEASDALGARRPRLPRQVVIVDQQLAKELLRLHASMRQDDSSLAVEEHFASAIELVCQQLVPAPKQETPRANHPSVRRAVELLQERWADPVTLTELAAATALSPSALVRQFRREMGMPPHSFQLNIRILNAREMLRKGLPPAEVAFTSGFYDQAHLTRVFKRTVGVPPHRFATA
jgi:AraC-like DNA-binding protein